MPYTVYQHGHRMADGHGFDRHRSHGEPWEPSGTPSTRASAGLYDEYRETSASGCTGRHHRHQRRQDWRPGDRQGQPDGAGRSRQHPLHHRRGLLQDARGQVRHPPRVVGRHGRAPYYFPKGGDPSVLRYVWPPKAQGRRGATSPTTAWRCSRTRRTPCSPTCSSTTCWTKGGAQELRLAGIPAAHRSPWIPTSWSMTGRSREPGLGDHRAGGLRAWARSPQQLTPEQDERWLDAWSRVQQGG